MAKWSSGANTSRRPPRLGGGRYLVTTELGRGVSSDVYAAFDLKYDTWRALKLLAMDYREDANMRLRFEKEAQALSQIRHRNVIRVFDIHLDAFQPFISMELATGGCLIDWIKKKGPMPAQLAVEVAAQICDGLTAAHNRGIVHRDVKPHNLLVNERGVVKVTDFGVASVDDDDDHASMLTQAGAALGTFAFMPPEQRADPNAVDHRADVYATAATFYTLLTGRTATELFMADMDDKLLADVHDALQDVILKGAAYKPDDRYQSMEELRAALQEATMDITQAHSELPSLLTGMPLELPTRPPERLADGVRLAEIERALAMEGKARGGSTPTPIPKKSEPDYLEEDESPTNPGGVGGIGVVIGIQGTEAVEMGALPIQELATPPPTDRREPEKPRTPTPAPTLARPRTPTPPPAPKAETPPPAEKQYVVFEQEAKKEAEPEPPRGLRADPRVWAFVSLMFATMMVSAFMFVFAFYSARHQILVARAEYQGAERALASVIRDEKFVVEKLEPGMPRIALRELYFQHDDAEGLVKLGQGIHFVNEVELQYALMTPQPARHTEIGRAITKLQAARAKVLVSRNDWRASTRGVRPVVILALGLAESPD